MTTQNYDFDIDAATIFLAVTGSHAYGMARPTSDVDIRGALVTPQYIRDSFYRKFDQYTTTEQVGPWGPNSAKAIERMAEHPTAGPCYEACEHQIDVVVYDINKLVQDMIFSTPAWNKLREARHLFLSTRCKHTYMGYAMSQLKRIRGHRAWLLDPPTKEPTRAEFGLPEESTLPADVRNLINEEITKTIRRWGVEDGLDEFITGAPQDVLRERMKEFWTATLSREGHDTEDLDSVVYETALEHLGLTRETLAALKQERAYRAARKHWQQYQHWKKHRNEARASLEAEHGYDTKHASHLIRLLRTGLEILQTGEIIVRRPDAKELMEIRNGKWTYEKLMTEAEGLDAQIRDAYDKSTLPRQVDLEKIDAVLFDVLNG